ncbi:MAG: chemotaxis protein CheW [Gemmatimonadetes bacterium]|nr:chemotaxis protein CheW [Gemmatimonadota bacterium]
MGYADIGLAAPSGASKHLLLRAGDRFFAVPILEVREVLPRQDYVRLPGAGPAVCGLISVRSRVLTVLDFAAAVGLGRSSAGADHRVVVLEHGERSVGLAVDAVVEIAELVPEALSASGEKPVEGDPEAPYLVAVGEAAGFRFAVIGVSELVAAWLA